MVNCALAKTHDKPGRPDRDPYCFVIGLLLSAPFYALVTFFVSTWFSRQRQEKLRRAAALLIGSIIILGWAGPVGETNAEVGGPPQAAGPSLHQWGAVTMFHGLPSDHVRAVAQDSSGMTWFGTDGGLVKYDGRRIQKIATAGPAAARVLAIKIDAEGVLWLGTDAGAARLISGEVTPMPETRGSAVSAIITPETGRAMMTSLQGEIFDCSSGEDGSLAVHKIESADHPLLTIESRNRAPLQLTSLALVGETLVVGTHSRGLLAIDAGVLKANAAATPDSVKEILSRPRPFFVEAIETDARGQIWFGAETSAGDSGLYDASDLTRPQKIGEATGTVTALGFDAGGNIWVGTDSRGAFVYRDGHRLDQFTFESTAGGLLSNHVYSIFIDREGVVWFGTDRGVCRYDPHAVRAEMISADAESNFARALFQASDGALWCGTNRGLFVRDGNGNWRESRDLKGRVIHSIAEDSQGRLLIGTAAGLFLSDKRSANRIQRGAVREFSRVDSAAGAPDNIRAIASFKGALYVANFGRGVERVDGLGRALVWPGDTAGELERQVVSLHADNDRLWIGTAEAGVFLFDGRKSVTNPALDELIGAGVWSIAGSGDDVVWLGSARGLYALRSDQLVRVIEGVDARWIVPVSDGGSNPSAWCAAVGGGLYKALLDEENGHASFLTTNIDTEQGLPSQSAFAVASTREAAGRRALWVGTNRGVARYEPGLVAPAVTVTRVMGKRIYDSQELANGLNLEFPQNSLAVDLAAISSRTFPERFQYSFLVLDDKGRVVSEKLSRESQLLIEGMPPGRYRVVARAYANDLVPTKPLRFDFVVARAPFPWTSTALSVLLGLALLSIWWGYRQNRRLAGTNRQLADTRMQLANETETERRRIARDLHDQTLADLRRLMMLTDELPVIESNGHVKPAAFREEIESISTEIRRICEDLSPSALANVGLAAALEWALAEAVAHQPADKKFEYEFMFDAGIEDRFGLEPAIQIQIYRIVQEAISNVCRHSAATRVRLTLKAGPDGDLLIELEDNGGGFDADKPGKPGRGLSNIRSRASLIQARAEWNSRPGGGTLFTLTIAPEVERHDISGD